MSPESWQQRNTEAPKPTLEKKEESAADFEKKLSPEQIEQIMAKVQDIDEKGIAFSLIKDDKFENILDDGLLGSYESPHSVMSSDIDKKEWVERTRKERQSNIYFNITGRQRDDLGHPKSDSEGEIAGSSWIAANSLSKNKIVVLFSINQFKEDSPILDRRHENAEFKTKTYRPIVRDVALDREEFYKEEVAKTKYDSDEYKKIADEATRKIRQYHKFKEGEELNPQEDYGFVLSHRIAPRLFKGIVVKFIPDSVWDKRNEQGHYWDNVSYDFTQQEFHDRLKPYLRMMLGKDGQKNLVPIYDGFGNLAWPKQMSHDEVKAFVAERDAKKEGESE